MNTPLSVFKNFNSPLSLLTLTSLLYSCVHAQDTPPNITELIPLLENIS